MPKNASTDWQYSGVNVLILWGAVIERGFTGQSWLTFRQALSLGGHVRKGERGIRIAFSTNDERTAKRWPCTFGQPRPGRPNGPLSEAT
jgi:antirestriction protein ArdC